jgi:hypothetical protein
MPALSATIKKQLRIPSMNYLALGNDVYFFRDGALHCRSNGVTEQLNWKNLTEDEIEFYANLAYHLEQINSLTSEYANEVFTK